MNPNPELVHPIPFAPFPFPWLETQPIPNGLWAVFRSEVEMSANKLILIINKHEHKHK